jgi:hypothetical protein
MPHLYKTYKKGCKFYYKIFEKLKIGDVKNITINSRKISVIAKVVKIKSDGHYLFEVIEKLT